MFDTIGVLIPLSEHLFEEIKLSARKTTRTDCITGEIIFEYSDVEFHPSHSYKVMVQVKNEAWIRDEGSKTPRLQSCRPYLRMEFSIPKVLFCHNLLSVDTDRVLESCEKVKTVFERVHNCSIPFTLAWYVYRIDTCSNFMMDDLKQVKNMILHLQQLDYPRKPKGVYDGNNDAGIYFATRHNTLKIYSKGLEFRKHDAKRLRGQFTSDEEFAKMQFEADKILRVEVEHRRSLAYLVEKNEVLGKFLNSYNLIEVLEKIDFKTEMVRIMKKILCGTHGVVVNSLDVYSVLVNALGSKSGNFYYSIYSRIVTHGQNVVKLSIKRPTYYRALKIFRELDISLVSTDLYRSATVNRGFPKDFSLEISEENKYYQMPLAA